MDLPSSREIELETLLRQRDVQIAELTDEVIHLRQYLNTQPKHATADPILLPPALVSLVLPHIKDRSSTTATTASTTVTAALTQRVKVLQEENDELYELLKSGETGRLKEDVRSLRRVVVKLEGALKESHQVVISLQDEVDKSHAVIMANSRAANNMNSYPHSHSQSPVPLRSSHQPRHQLPSATNGSQKPPPTAPRAHKKPRLSDARISPTQPHQPLPPPPKMNRSQSDSTRRNDSRERSPRVSDRKLPHIPHNKMNIDEDERKKPRSPERNRDQRDRERGRNHDRDRERDRVRDKERDRDRDRERDRTSRRSGGGGGGRRGQRSSNTNPYAGADRTLAERMGL